MSSQPSLLSDQIVNEPITGKRRIFEVNSTNKTLLEFAGEKVLQYRPVFLAQSILGSYSASKAGEYGDVYTQEESIEFNRRTLEIAAQGGMKYNDNWVVKHASKGMCDLEKILSSGNKL
jgi:hypothetical protein